MSRSSWLTGLIVPRAGSAQRRPYAPMTTLPRLGACNGESTLKETFVDSPTPTRGAVLLDMEGHRRLEVTRIRPVGGEAVSRAAHAGWPRCNECLSAWKPMCRHRCAALIEGAAGGADTFGS